MFLLSECQTSLETMSIFQGTDVVQVSAYDGDYAHPKRLRYGLDPTGLPYSNYFDIDPDTGVVKVKKSLQVCKEVCILHNWPIACCIIQGKTRQSKVVKKG